MIECWYPGILRRSDRFIELQDCHKIERFALLKSWQSGLNILRVTTLFTNITYWMTVGNSYCRITLSVFDCVKGVCWSYWRIPHWQKNNFSYFNWRSLSTTFMYVNSLVLIFRAGSFNIPANKDLDIVHL